MKTSFVKSCFWKKTVLFFIFLIGTGCFVHEATQTDQTYNLIQEVQDRVVEYFNYRKMNNLKGFYNILSPEFREKHSFSEFKEMPKEYTIGLASYNINGIEIESKDKAKVWVSEYFKPSGIPAFFVLPNRELIWVKIDGVWYLEKTEPAKKHDSTCGGFPKKKTGEETCGN